MTAGVSGAAARTAPVPLRRNSGFRMLWIGQVLSGTGTAAAGIALPLLILTLTRSVVTAGAVGTVRLVVQLVLGLPGGALADRFDRRLTMIVCDALRAVVLGVLTVLVLAHLASWPVVLAVAVVDAAGNVLFNPSAVAALPGIVPDEQLQQARLATEARSYGAALAGPALGGFLFGLGSAVPFLADAVSYLVSVGTVSRIRGTFRPPRAGARKALWREAADGVGLAVRIPLLRAVLIQAPLINFAANGVIFTITLALRKDGTAPAVIGLAQAGIMAGGLVGALVAPRARGRQPVWRSTIVISVAGFGLFAVAALVLPSPLAAVPVAATLALAPAANAKLAAAMLRATPDQMRGRVNNTLSLVAMGLAALAPLTAGLLVQHLSGQWAIAAFAAAMGVAAILSIALRGLRNTVDR